jgi:cytochrome c556
MKLSQLFMITALAASTVFANDHLNQIRDHAGRLGKQFQDIQTKLKDKQFNVAEVKDRVSTIDGDIENLKRLSAQFEEANPSMAASKDWRQAKEAMLLISMFHEQKSQLLEADARTMRTEIRAKAQNLAIRAIFLEKTSTRLLKTMGGGA